MSDKKIEKIKADLILEPLNSAQELQDWMYMFLDIKFPMGVVYPNSTHGPIDAMWFIYECMKTGKSRDIPQACMMASRDSYKTLSAAALEVLCMLHFEISIAHGAAIKSQSEKAIQYVNSFFRKVGPYLEVNNWKKISDSKAKIEWLTPKGDAIYLRIVVATVAGMNCIKGNSVIRTSVGKMTAEEIYNRLKNGEDIKVLSYNHKTQKEEFKPILNWQKVKHKKYYKIKTTSNKEIEVSDGHKVYEKNKGYIKASSLKVGDICQKRIGNYRNKLDFNSIVKEFKAEKYTVLTKEIDYINTKTKIKTECPLKHLYHVSYHGFKHKKNRCPKCQKNNNKINTEDIVEEITSRGYEYISGDYKDQLSKIKIKCNKHGIFEKMFTNFKYGNQGCPKCSNENMSIKMRYPYKCFKKDVEDSGYKLITNKDMYVNYKNKVKISCDKGHIYESRVELFKRGSRCPKCFSSFKTSNKELEILEWVRDFYPNAHKAKFKDLGIDNTEREIDIYIPSLKLGIEYCGLYWHCEYVSNKKNNLTNFKKKHMNKFLDAENKNIHIITIFSDEWDLRKAQIKNFLKAKMKLCDRKVYARKCDIKEIPWDIAKNFLEKYHIQGKPSSSKYSLGLYYKEELLAVLTSSPHHRQGHSSTFVLNRLCFKDGVYVIGGSSKLNKKLLEYCKKNKYKSLISWSDNRFSKGDVYKSLNYNLSENLKMDYSYVDGSKDGRWSKRQSKQSNKKANLLKKGAVGTMENTERELAISIDLWRIWDCGKRRWVIDVI